MSSALVLHDRALGSVIASHGGVVFSTAGDGWAAAFPTAAQAVSAAVAAQRALADQAWPDGVALPVRMGYPCGGGRGKRR